VLRHIRKEADPLTIERKSREHRNAGIRDLDDLDLFDMQILFQPQHSLQSSMIVLAG
jgi:hypothetical protein